MKQVGWHERLLLSNRAKLAPAARAICAAKRIEVVREPFSKRMVVTEMSISARTRAVYLVGYWQAYSIVAAIEDELRSDFSLREQQAGRNAETAKLISGCRNPISIHLRRGDYLSVFGKKAILPASYYEAAIQRMTNLTSEPTFFVFSDDTAEARAWAETKTNFVVVDHNEANFAHEDLRLMSQCRHHIIANSTFSWWGAWLNHRTDKHVIAPSKWLEFDTRDVDIAPPGWELLDS
jgi:hypothetical protein